MLSFIGKRKQFEESSRCLDLLCSDWFLSTLFEYLSVRDIVHMDSAMYNKSYRSRWETCLSKDFGDLSNRIQVYLENDEAVKWCVKKNITFKKLNFRLRIKAHDWERLISNKGMMLLANQCVNLKELFIHERMSEILTEVAAHCNYLEVLDICGEGAITTQSLIDIGRHCHRLKVINLQTDDNSITHEGLKGLLINCSQLIKFSCSERQRISFFHLLSEYCPLLESIEFEFSELDTDDHIETLTKMCTKLKSINVNGSRLRTDMVLRVVGKNCARLENFRFCPKYYPILDRYSSYCIDGLRVFATGCPLLKYVEIIGLMTTVTAESSRLFINNCAHLEYLNIGNGMSDDVLIALSRCTTLKKLNLFGSDVSDYGLIAVIRSNPLLEDINFHCEYLTDGCLFAIGQTCRKLKKFSAYSNANFTDEGIRAVMAANPSLESINIYYCEQLTSDSLIAIGEYCHDLTKLIIRGNLKLTDAGVQAVVQKNRKLETIYLSYCPLLTDATLVAIAEHCPYLKGFSVTNALDITDNGIKQLVISARYLEGIDISSCQLLTNTSLEHIGNYCNVLRVFYCEMELDSQITKEGFQYIFEKCKQARWSVNRWLVYLYQ